MVIYHKKRI